MTLLIEDGIRKIKEGITSIEEVIAVATIGDKRLLSSQWKEFAYGTREWMISFSNKNRLWFFSSLFLNWMRQQ